MSEFTQILRGRSVVACDLCLRTDVTDVFDGTGGPEKRAQEKRLAATGWRLYLSRSRRHYCPDCRPKPGHRMSLIWGTEKETG